MKTDHPQQMLPIPATPACRGPVTGTPRFYDDSVPRGVTYAGMAWTHAVAVHPQYPKNGWIHPSYGIAARTATSPGLTYGWPLVSLGVDYGGFPIRYAERYGIEFNPAGLEPTI